jgi:hypothetical protein
LPTPEELLKLFLLRTSRATENREPVVVTKTQLALFAAL